MSKICTGCHIPKDISEYGTTGRGSNKPKARCKACDSAYAMAWKKRNRAKNPSLPKEKPIMFKKLKAIPELDTIHYKEFELRYDKLILKGYSIQEAGILASKMVEQDDE